MLKLKKLIYKCNNLTNKWCNPRDLPTHWSLPAMVSNQSFVSLSCFSLLHCSAILSQFFLYFFFFFTFLLLSWGSRRGSRALTQAERAQRCSVNKIREGVKEKVDRERNSWLQEQVIQRERQTQKWSVWKEEEKVGRRVYSWAGFGWFLALCGGNCIVIPCSACRLWQSFTKFPKWLQTTGGTLVCAYFYSQIWGSCLQA